MKSSKTRCILLCSQLVAGACFAQQEPVPISQEIVPDHLAYLYSKARPAGSERTFEQLVAGKRRWENGRRLRVCFFSGNPVVTHLVRTVASEWTLNTGVTLDFGPNGSWYNCLDPKVGFAEIRVGFSERGYWSYVGSDSERYGGERAPSMNFDSLNRAYSDLNHSINDVVQKADPYHKAAIRHEYGHALGLLHEHQNPKLDCFSQIKWNGPDNVYEQFARHPNYWTPEQVDRNLGLIRVTDPDFIAGEGDSESVMKYPLLKSILINPSDKCVGSVNYEISQKDRQFVEKIYPRDGSRSSIPAVSETLATAFVMPTPQFVTQNDSSDYIQRVLEDLESEDVATRRNARVRLSQVFGQPTAQNAVNAMIIDLPEKGYRYKLGVAVALASVNRAVEISKPAAKIIADQRKRAIDSTLRSYLKTAASKIKSL